MRGKKKPTRKHKRRLRKTMRKRGGVNTRSTANINVVNVIEELRRQGKQPPYETYDIKRILERMGLSGSSNEYKRVQVYRELIPNYDRRTDPNESFMEDEYFVGQSAPTASTKPLEYSYWPTSLQNWWNKR